MGEKRKRERTSYNLIFLFLLSSQFLFFFGLPDGGFLFFLGVFLFFGFKTRSAPEISLRVTEDHITIIALGPGLADRFASRAFSGENFFLALTGQLAEAFGTTDFSFAAPFVEEEHGNRLAANATIFPGRFFGRGHCWKWGVGD